MSAADALRQLSQHLEICQVFVFQEVCSEELQLEAEMEVALREVTGGAGQVVRCWGYTLHHIDDLEACGKAPERWITPYLSFGNFKRDIAACKVRPVNAEWKLPEGHLQLTKPPASGVEWGSLPSLPDLGFDESFVSDGERSAVPWRGGESFALARVQQYIWERRGLKQYVGTTDWSAGGKCGAPRDQTSKLSPYLAFGCVSPRLLYWEIQRFEKSDRCKGARGLINSLLWRDFYRFIVHFAWGDRLFHLYGPMSCGSVPGGHKVPTKWCCKHYNNLFGGSDPRLWTWKKDLAKFERWAEGRTGYPFVDAAMLELKETGYMLHLNRETVGWFFMRDLQLDWRLAAEWFESRLLDHDCVLNWGNWAYFILTQLPSREDDRPGGGPRYTLPRYSPYLMASQVLGWGRDHDPDARYVKKWIPSLQSLPPELCREPWKADLTDATDDAESDWTCAACTLQNLAQTRRCEACLARRPCASLYVAPLVPPPPEQLGLCGSCGAMEVNGWESEEAIFFCEDCWAQWLASQVQVNMAQVTGTASDLDPDAGWALVPELAPTASAVAAAAAPDRGPRKGARWAVRGNRSDKLAGG
ncbi:unnamed protein product [Effrenium voratum]|uniref:RanBP2-type domain-containing protein n=1 Tax=Effrenium voratum TaxID=2562239 RepID=A0AA36MM19_9DINO|nr:unnamed protein product [Effrenium voratum]